MIENEESTGSPDSGASSHEVEALLRGCGLVHRPWRGVLRIAGADRVRFLQGYVTCDVEGVAAGAWARGFVTDRKGHVLADFDFAVSDDHLDLLMLADRVEPVLRHLEMYVLADRVNLSMAEEETWSLAGPSTLTVLESEGIDVPEIGAHRDAGNGLRMIREADRRVPVVTLMGPASAGGPFVEKLLARQDVDAVGGAAWDVLRVEAGVLRFGSDFDGSNFPQEVGRADAISFEKGCYLGQEIVARIHYRGGVQKEPRGLRISGVGAEAAASSELLLEGRGVGRLGSVVDSPRQGLLGLAVVHRRGAEPGTVLDLEGGGHAEVVTLPFDV